MEGKGLGLSNSGLAYDESFKNVGCFFYFYLWMILSTLGGSWKTDTRYAPLVAASRPAMEGVIDKRASTSLRRVFMYALSLTSLTSLPGLGTVRIPKNYYSSI